MRSNAQRKHTVEINQQHPAGGRSVDLRGQQDTSRLDEGFVRVLPLDEKTSHNTIPLPSTKLAVTRGMRPVGQDHSTTPFSQQTETTRMLPPGTRPITRRYNLDQQTIGSREAHYRKAQSTGQSAAAIEETYGGQQIFYTNTSKSHLSQNQLQHGQRDDVGGDNPTSNLRKRNGKFWEKPEEEELPQAPLSEEDHLRLRNSSQAKKVLLGILLAMIGVAFFLTKAVFVVKDVQVGGVPADQAEAVLKAAGIQHQQSIFTIDEEAVAANLNNSSRWMYGGMKKDLFGSIELFVQERTPVAVLRRWGTLYFIDSKGMVLAQSEDIEAKYVAMPEISGLRVDHISVGSFLNVQDKQQWTVLHQVITNIKALPALKMITNVNVSDKKNILVTTVDGISVRLGDSSRMFEKMKAMIATVDGIKRTSRNPLGTLDLTTPTRPTFHPEGKGERDEVPLQMDGEPASEVDLSSFQLESSPEEAHGQTP